MMRLASSSRRGCAMPLSMRRSVRALALSVPVWMALGGSAVGATIYSNTFEANATGFTNGGTLPALTRASLPTDAGGLASPNQSMWLGQLGQNINKNSGIPEIVDLVITGLAPGATYTVAFDLLVGASWDGAAGGYGPDGWYFAVDGTRLVDTIFSNGDQGVDYGAYSPQRYTDTHYTDPNLPDVAAYTGAEYWKKQGPGYSGYYGIYYFSHGAGNPVLTFVAAGTTATLEWARTSGSGDSADEYWALDNVVVTGPPGGPCAGDITGDGVTNSADFNVLALHYGQSVPPGTLGDLSGDGVVNSADFNILAGDFGCGA